MSDTPTGPPADLPAGDFSPWLATLQAAVRGERDADVPCDGCTACCTASQFVHIGPDESDTLRHVPGELVFPAPGRPAGHVLLGYDERGHCPMLVDGACSIYEHRPRTCRTYDCRIFPAAGVTPDADKPRLAERVQRWRFDHPTETDRVEHDAVRAAATFVRDHAGELADAAPRTQTQRAGLAIELHDRFLAQDAGGEPTAVQPDPVEVRVELLRRPPF